MVLSHEERQTLKRLIDTRIRQRLNKQDVEGLLHGSEIPDEQLRVRYRRDMEMPTLEEHKQRYANLFRIQV